jgi:hypothetical protein
MMKMKPNYLPDVTSTIVLMDTGHFFCFFNTIIMRPILFVFSCFLFHYCAIDAPMVNSMTAFNNDLLQLWREAQEENAGATARLIETLQQQRQQVEEDYSMEFRQVAEWEETYVCLDELLTVMELNMTTLDFASIIDAAEAMQFELMNLRIAYDIDYAVDPVWEIKLGVDLIERLTEDRYYCLEAVEFDWLLEELQQNWVAVSTNKVVLSTTAPHLSEKRRLVQAISEELERLVQMNKHRAAEELLPFDFESLNTYLRQLIYKVGDVKSRAGNELAIE